MIMDFLQQICYAVIAAAVPVLTTFLCKWLQALYESNKSKMQNEKVQVVLGQVTDMITAAVETTTNTYVKELKANNVFDINAQKEAFNKTFDAVQKQLTADSVKIITDAYGDADIYITNKIEQLVEQTKR
jgi:ABC-type Fe3+-hydroxamate transport system substrate-binding protein